jgi:hypothetical protein
MFALVTLVTSEAGADKPQAPAGVPGVRDPLAACERHPQEHATAWTCANGLYTLEVVAPVVLTKEQVDQNLKGYAQTFIEKNFKMDNSDFVLSGKAYPSVRASGENDGFLVAQMVIAPTAKRDTHLIACSEKTKTSSLCGDVLAYLVGKTAH